MPFHAPSPLDHGLRLPPPPAMPTCIPPLPTAWQGTDRMNEWLKAKAEEDKRRQEEERTHQAQLILELRRVEQAMISDSLRAGVPPHMIPMIFNGIHTTGANPHLAMELQRQWSAPSATIPQHTPQQVFPGSHPFPSTLHQSAPQGPGQASQKPPQVTDEESPEYLDAAFKNTFPLIASLTNAVQPRTQPDVPSSRVDARDKINESVEYHYRTTGQMESPRSQQAHARPPPSHPLQPQPRSLVNNTFSAPSTTFLRNESGVTKRKDKNPHEKRPPPPLRLHVQTRAINPHGESDVSSSSGLNVLSEFIIWDDGSSRKPSELVTADQSSTRASLD